MTAHVGFLCGRRWTARALLGASVLLTFILIFPGYAEAQISVGQNVQVSSDRSGTPHYEHLAGADPENPNRMMACSMLSDAEGGTTISVVYTSHDGGRTWNETLSVAKGRMSGDPVCEFGLDGKAYFVVLTLEEDANSMLVYRSDDGGLTWEEPVRLPFIDRENFAIDRSGGDYHGRIYINGTGTVHGLGDERISALTLFRSLDGGRSFQGPVQRASFDPTYVVGMGNSVVLSDGTLVTLFGHVKDRAKIGDEHNQPGQPNSWLKVATSDDGGETYSIGTVVSDWYMARRRAPGSHIPWLAVDSGSSALKDRLYAVWNDFENERLEVLLAHSDDGGKTWSDPVDVVREDRIRTDPKQGPDQNMPLVAVNEHGVVGVAWYDRRQHPDNLGWYLRFSASLDGGETFLPSVQVSSAPSNFGGEEGWPISGNVSGGGTPTPAQPAEEPSDPRLTVRLGVNSFFYSSGHTSGLVVGPDGAFYPVWSDNRSGVSQLWTAPLNVQGMVFKHGSAELAELEDVSAKVTLDLGDFSYDRATNTATMTARLRNTSEDDIQGPVKVRVIALGSEIGVAEILNADNGETGIGAVFDFTSLLDGDMLRPEAMSEPKEFRFRLSDIRPFEQNGRFRFGLVHLEVRVLAEGAPEDG